jgi:hypothetical protein
LCGQINLVNVCAVVESKATGQLHQLAKQLDASCEELQRHIGSTDISKFVFFNNASKSLRLYGFGCAIGTDAAAKGNTGTTSASMTSSAIVTQIPRPLLLAADTIRHEFSTSVDSGGEEAIFVPLRDGGAVVARKLGVREVYVFFEGKLPIPDMHRTFQVVVLAALTSWRVWIMCV